MQRLARVLVSVAAFASSSVDAAALECPSSPPDVATLVASRTNPASEAWIVYPNCTIEEVPLDSAGTLTIWNHDIERVDSVPTQMTRVELTYAPLSRGGDFSNAKHLKELFLDSSRPGSLDIFVWPPTIETLKIRCDPRCDIDSMRGIEFPESVEYLAILQTKISSLDGAKFPSRLKELLVNDGYFTSLVDVDFGTLERLVFSENSITTLTGVTFPNSMTVFECAECPIVRVQGVKWPKDLKALNFYDDKILSFEIRESDLPAFMSLEFFGADEKFQQTTCEDQTANITALKVNPDISICVISDERFEELYAVHPSPTPVHPSLPSLSPSGSRGDGSGSQSDSSIVGDDEVVGQETGADSGIKKPRSARGTSIPSPDVDSGDATGGVSIQSENLTSGSSGEAGNKRSSSLTRQGIDRSQNSPSLSSTDSSGAGQSSETKPSSHEHTVLIGSLAGGICVLVAGFVLYRVGGAAKKRRGKDLSDNDYRGLDSPVDLSTEGASEPDWSVLESLTESFRNEHVLAGYRIDQNAIALQTLLAKGKSGVVYRAAYHGQPVAIRQMLPNAWRDEAALSSFMDEIRMCATLSHAKITVFIGVASTSIRDLTAVTEYMAGGDLATLIHKHPESTGREWFDTWTPSQLPGKAQMAADVAEAIVYLHSFTNPIIHRDLKTKKVLLDGNGTAKLGNFGIGREVNVDAVMASEDGAPAWMAPEVLRGDRYDEKADIYSFGVLLVELDRCEHPFKNDPALASADSNAVERNSRMVRLVGSGQLQPSPSQECPETIKALIGRCVNFEPSERPTAMEVFYGLRIAQKSV